MASTVPPASDNTAQATAGTIDASIPTGEIAQLEALAKQGLLSGVDPAILAAQDQAESSGQGGAVNAEGDGGFFGLAANTPYGAQGLTVSPTALTGTDATSFDTQAEAAAALDASLLGQYGGNTTEMEQAYQLGPNSPLVGTPTATEGTTVFATDHVPATDPAGTATTTGLNWNPLDGFGIPGTIAGAVGGAVGSAASSAGNALVNDLGPLLLKMVFVVGALGLIVLGLSRMFPGVTRTVTSAVPSASQTGGPAGASAGGAGEAAGETAAIAAL